MQKFRRNYRCVFEIGNRYGSVEEKVKEITISYPISLVFSVERTIYSDCNTGKFKFYNLSEDKQTDLYKMLYEENKYIKMFLYAGYGENMPLIFYGLVNQCSSYRNSGDVDFITEMEATDQSFLFRYGFTNATLQKDTSSENVLRTILSDIPDIKIGYISPKIPQITQDTLYFGQPMDIITREYSGYQVYIDQGVLNILGERDVIPGEIYVITANSGLLGSPKVNGLMIEVEMIFEPGIVAGQEIILASDSIRNFNGNYKVVGFTHSGTISPITCGKLTTKITLFKGDFNKLQKTSNKYEEKTDKEWTKPVNASITSEFGWRTHPIKKDKRFHGGIDYGCSNRTQVKAASNGKVISSGVGIGGLQGYGLVIYVDNGTKDGKAITSLYAHLSQSKVSSGQQIYKNDVIALSGGVPGDKNAGYSTGPHLHFEIREDNKPVNPHNYIG